MLYTARSLQLSLHLLPLSGTPPLRPPPGILVILFQSLNIICLLLWIHPRLARDSFQCLANAGERVYLKGGGGRSIAII